MKILNDNLNKRFMKDVKMPCTYVNKQVFADRLDLFEEEHKTKTLYKEFLEMIENFGKPEDYFRYVSNLMKEINNYIKSTDNFKEIKELKAQDLRKTWINIPGKTLFKKGNVNEYYLTLDINKANFNVIKKMSNEKNLLTDSESYEEFLSNFTEYDYIKQSKSFRQALLGQLRVSKRVQAYQKMIVSKATNVLIEKNMIEKKDIKLLLHDELTIKLDKEATIQESSLKSEKIVEIIKKETGFEFSRELYLLEKLEGLDAYNKKHFFKADEVKGLSKFLYPAYYKIEKGLEVYEDDLLFKHEGLISKFVELPSFEVER